MFARPANALTKVSLLTKSRADLANFSMKVTLAYCSRIIPSHSLFYSSCPILLSSTADWYTLKARRQVPCSSQCSTPSTSFWLWSHSIYSWLTFWLRSKTGVGHILIIFEYTKYPGERGVQFLSQMGEQWNVPLIQTQTQRAKLRDKMVIATE